MGKQNNKGCQLAEMIFFKSSLFSFLVLSTGAQVARQEHHSQKQECHTEMKTVLKYEYIEKEEEQCRTIDEEWRTDVCKPSESKECKKHKEKICTWEKDTECKEEDKKVQIPYTETECETQKKKVCDYQWENTGSGKIWAQIPSTCKFVDEEECKNVEKTREKKIKEKVCKDVPKKNCNNEEELVLCTTKITDKCEQECTTMPKKICEKVHRKTPVRVSKNVPHLFCKNTEDVERDAVPANSLQNAVPAVPAVTATAVPDVTATAVPAVPATTTTAVPDNTPNAVPAVPANSLDTVLPAVPANSATVVPTVPANAAHPLPIIIVKDPTHRHVCRNNFGDQVPCA